MKIRVDRMPETTADCPFRSHYTDQYGIVHMSNMCGWCGSDGNTACYDPKYCPYFTDSYEDHLIPKND